VIGDSQSFDDSPRATVLGGPEASRLALSCPGPGRR